MVGNYLESRIEDEEVFREFYKLFELCIYLLQDKKNKSNYSLLTFLAEDNSKECIKY